MTCGDNGGLTVRGEPCKRKAGWGVPGTNDGPCKDHLDAATPTEPEPQTITAPEGYAYAVRIDTGTMAKARALTLTPVALQGEQPEPEPPPVVVPPVEPEPPELPPVDPRVPMHIPALVEGDPVAATFVQWSDHHTPISEAHYAAGGQAQVYGRLYYDPALPHLAHYLRSGDPEYLRRGEFYASALRENWEAANHNVVQERLWFADGLALHYWITGDERSRDAVHGVAFKRDLHKPDTCWNWQRMRPGNYKGEARPMARVLMVLGMCHRLGYTDQPWGELAIRYMERMLDSEMYVTDPSDYRYGAWWYKHPDEGPTHYVSNFMQSMIADSLIDIYDHVTPDPRIPGIIERMSDYLCNTQWRGPEGNGLAAENGEPSPSFNYYDVNLTNPDKTRVTPQVDLNGLYVRMLAWNAARTGKHRGILDQVVDTLTRSPDGKRGPWLTGVKQFNQTAFRSWQR